MSTDWLHSRVSCCDMGVLNQQRGCLTGILCAEIDAKMRTTRAGNMAGKQKHDQVQMGLTSACRAKIHLHTAPMWLHKHHSAAYHLRIPVSSSSITLTHSTFCAGYGYPAAGLCAEAEVDPGGAGDRRRHCPPRAPPPAERSTVRVAHACPPGECRLSTL